jgi:hypothetical protein
MLAIDQRQMIGVRFRDQEGNIGLHAVGPGVRHDVGS